jgi:hypothetical protein
MDRKKSLEVAVTGALAGLMTGAAIGIATAPSHSDIGRDEFSIFGISAVAAGFSVGRKKQDYSIIYWALALLMLSTELDTMVQESSMN